MSALRECLRRADLAPEVQFGGARAWSDSFASSETPGSTFATSPSTASFVEYFRRLNPVQKGFVYSEVKQAIAQESPEMLAGEIKSSVSASRVETEMLPVVRSVSDVLQVHSSYIVTQDDRGLVIIDQHALHERVMFEKLKARIDKGNLESQRMLMPATVEVDRSQLARLDELRPLLTRIGIEAEPIGPNAIAVHAFTSLLFERGVDPVTFMTELFDKASSRNDHVSENSEAALHEVLDMMACKAAIKAGDKLAPEELAELLKFRETVERASNCPHGRPTTLRLTIQELERQFGRT
jgi:DNA mismatch repair ATPase MutL